MKVYILKDKYGEFASTNCAIAYDGFRKMGWEIVTFSRFDNPRLPSLTADDVVIGFIEDVNASLEDTCLNVKSGRNKIGRSYREKIQSHGSRRC
jgi:hypothetical protein